MNSTSPIRSFEPFPPDAYLALSRELSRSPGEPARRSAIDRAYYAAFLTARNELNSKGYLTPGRGPQIHAQVIVALTQADRNSGRTLRSLRMARNRLTYQTGRVALPYGMTIETVLDSARIVIEAVRTLPINRAV